MSPFFQKLAGRVAVALALAIEGALGLATVIGMTTTSEDAKNLPEVVQWLLQTPWWVPSLVIPLILVVFSAWVFQPDFAVEKAMREYKSANDRSWAFEPEFRDKVEQFSAESTRLRLALERIESRHLELSNKLSEIRLNLIQQVGTQAKIYAESKINDTAQKLEYRINNALDLAKLSPFHPLGRDEFESLKDLVLKMAAKESAPVAKSRTNRTSDDRSS